MLLFHSACRLLSVGFERVDMTSSNPPFKLKPENECFKDLVDILTTQFVKPIKFYHKGLIGAIDFVYKVRLLYVFVKSLRYIIKNIPKLQFNFTCLFADVFSSRYGLRGSVKPHHTVAS